MRTLKGFLYLILGGTLCGWMFNRIAAWFIDNPLTVGSNHTVAEWAVILQDPFYLDSRTMPFFFLAFGALALVTMTKYDWTGEREEQKKLRGEEYGNQRWARDDEMQQFAHTSTVKRVPIRIPQRTADAMRFARNNPKDFIKARLGMTNKVANPKPDYVEKIEDDNIILSERAELQMSKIPDPALERNKHVNNKPDQINLSMHYNPLLYLQDSTSIMQIVNLLVENTSGNAEAEKEDFFVKAERQLYMALMGYLFYFYADQPQYQTFPQMLDLLQLAGKDNPSQTKTPLDIIMLGTTAEDGFQGFEEWIVANHGGDEAAAQASEEYFVIKQYKGFKSTSRSPETEASVIASCNVRLAPFAVSAVREFFSEDELELEMIGEERTAFFLVMSDTDKTFNFILAMLLYQLFDVNTAIADRNPGSHCKIPINCILDELANIGRIPDLDVKIATLRSRWIYITAILQSVTQLKKMYKDNADIIEGNCDTTLFLGRCDLETNKKISERLGKFTATVRNRSESHGRQGSWSESENKIGKELMAAADLGNNPEKFGGDDCIVFVKNAFPFLDKKYRTIDHPRYHELREVGEFNLDDWNWDRKCERDRVHRAEVEEMRWRIEEARSFFDPEFFM